MSTHQKDTTIELHRLYNNGQQNAQWLYQQFQHLEQHSATHICGDKRFEILELDVKPDRICGVVRKFQYDNFPRYGHQGGNENLLNIPRGAGLINRVHFAFYIRDGLLAIQRNAKICTASRFNSLLSELCGQTIVFAPVIHSDKIKRLEDNANEIRKVEVGFTGNPNTKPPDPTDFSNSAMAWMGAMNGYAGSFTMRGNGHTKDSRKRFLNRDVAKLARSWFKQGQLSKAKIWVEDLTHPIDLFEDKVVYVGAVDYQNRYPEDRSIKQVVQNAAQQYFDGDLG